MDLILEAAMVFLCVRGARDREPAHASKSRQAHRPGYIHLLVKVLSNAFAEREYHFADVPPGALLSNSHTTARLAQIDPDRARIAMPAPLLGKTGYFSDVPEGGSDPRLTCPLDTPSL